MVVIWLLLAVVGTAALSAALLLHTYARTANTLVALDERCGTALADIDVHLKHRHNLIPGLVEVVKGVSGHEREVVLGVAQARVDALAATGRAAKLKAERDLGAKVVTLLASAEQHPELRAIPEFGQLRQQLIDCENRITASRRFFNLAVEEYNVSLRQFPGSYIAARRQLSGRQPYDLGVERVLVDEPLSFAL